MKKFIVRIILFLLLVVGMDFAYGKVIEGMRAGCHSGDVMKEKLIADSINADVLIMGSSRAHMHYVPSIVEDSLGMTCFNCGMSGMGIVYNYGMLQIILERYTPKMIIYDFMPVLDVGTRDDNVIFLNQLRAFYDRNPIVKQMFTEYDKSECVKMQSMTYRYHSRFLEYLSGIRQQDYSKDGFNRQNESLQHDIPVDVATHYDVDSVKLSYFEKFIVDVKKRGIELVVCGSPRYGYTEPVDAFDCIEVMCKKYDVRLINHYSNTNYTLDKSLFNDATHFCYKGAEKWTKYLMSTIK